MDTYKKEKRNVVNSYSKKRLSLRAEDLGPTYELTHKYSDKH